MAYIGQRPVIGRYIKLDQISSGFNGSNTGFSMTAGSQAVFPGTARNLLLSLGGVIQEPDTDFTISGSTLTFTTPPVANTTFFGVIYGDMQATGTPSDGTVLPASIASSGHFKIPQLTVNEDGADVDFRVEGDTEANLLFVDASTDRVGIGTNSPAFKLHVNGTSRFGSTRINSTTESTDGAFNDLVIGDYSSNRGISILSGATGQGAVGFAKSGTTADGYLAYVHNGTATSSAMTLKSQGHIKFNAGSTTKLYIEHDGNVGIGDSSPAAGLDVKVDTNPVLAIDRGSANTANFNLQYNGTLTGQCSAANQEFQISAAGASTPLSFFTNGGARMTIDTDGRVKVNTANLLDAFQVDYGGGFNLVLDGAGNISQFRADGTTGGLTIETVITSGSFGSGGGFISLKPRGSDAFFIAGDGDIGIGTTSPLDKLAINYTVSSSVPAGGIRLQDNTNTTVTVLQTTVSSYNYAGVSGHYSQLYSSRDLALVADGANSGVIDFMTGNTKRITVRNDGFTCFGTSDHIIYNHSSGDDNGAVIDGAGSIQVARTNDQCMILNRMGTDGTVLSFHNDGTCVGFVSVSGSTTSYLPNCSDRTLKKNFGDWTEDTLSLFKDLTPQTFNFLTEQDTDTKHKGFIAQNEVDKFPEAYPKIRDDKYWFDPMAMVPYLMKAIQELNAKLEALEAG